MASKIVCLLALISPCIAPVEATADEFTSTSLHDVPALIRSFKDPNIRLGASKAIVKLGKPAVPRLIDAAGQDDVDVRIWSIYTLGEIGPDASTAAAVIADSLQSRDTNLRAIAARALGQVRGEDETVIQSLAESTTDVDHRVRRWSVVSLGQIGPAAIAATASLVEALDDQSVRASTIQSLVQFGASSIPQLIEALEDDTVRLEAAEALRQIDSKTAKRLGIEMPTIADLNALEISLGNPEKDLDARTSAATSLGTLGIEAAPILISTFSAESTDVVEASAAALGNIGSTAIPLLRDSLQHDSAQVRAASVDALAAIGPNAKEAESELIAALTDDDRNVRHRAVIAIRLIGVATEPAIAALIAVMQNPRDLEATRQLAVKTLARLVSPDHPQTIAALRESTKDKNYGVSSLAKEMLKSLEVNE